MFHTSLDISSRVTYFRLSNFEARSQNFEKRLLPSSCHVMSSVHMDHHGYHCTDFLEMLYLNTFLKYVVKSHVWLKSDKNNVYIT